MFTNTPIEQDGKIYDRLNVSLAITTRVEGGTYTAGAACRLVPMRILEDGTSEELPELAKSVLLGDTAGLDLDTPERVAMSAVYAAVQQFITAKGL